MDEIDRVKEELQRVRGFLAESHKQNDALLESKVSSAVYTVAKAFAEAAKIVRQDSGILPAWQIIESVKYRLEYAGIVPMQNVGDVVEFDPALMLNVNVNGPKGEKVEIVDPSYKMIINGNDYILSSAWVKNIENNE